MFYSKLTGGFYSIEIHGSTIPSDAVAISDEQHAALLSGQAAGQCIAADVDGAPILMERPAPALDEIVAGYESALDQHLNSVALSHRFKDRHSLALRAGYASAYQPLGLAFAQWMDGCNVLAYQALQEVIAGTKALPAVEDFIAALPAFVAP